MTLSAAPYRRKYSVAEYLRMEHAAEERHEFVDGDILSMAGGTYAHSVVITNVLGEWATALKDTKFRVTGATTRVGVLGRRSFHYPDVSVVCGPPPFDPADKRNTTILNPTLVVEVLSEGTLAYDRGDKFDRYRNVASLREYVMVSMSERRVETYFRNPDGGWAFASFTGKDAVAVFRSIRVKVKLSEIYDGADLSGKTRA